jgi:hypothetical protein
MTYNYKDMKKQKLSLKKSWQRWHYKNTLLLIISLGVFFYLAKMPWVDSTLRHIGTLGYLGAFITGVFFVSTFTVAPAGVVLYHLADTLHPVEVALLAGLGATLGDYIIFRFIKDEVFKELSPLLRKLGRPYSKVLFRSPYFAWLLPLTGAFIIASPFPDEIGVSMLGLSRLRQWQFFAVALALNAVGIFIVVTTARAL